MKILDVSAVTDSASMPLKSGSLAFIQAAYKDTNTAIVTSLLGFTPSAVIGYRLVGGLITNVGSTYTVTDGYLYFNTELFRIQGSTFNLGSGEQVFGKITNIPYPAADPVLFGDGVDRNIHLDRIITFKNDISGDVLYSNTIPTSVWQKGDIKWVYVDSSYIVANFHSNGLGKNEREGWRICNGIDSPSMDGRTPIGWGSNYSTVGTQGGSEDAVLVEHNHDSNGYIPGGSQGIAGGSFIYKNTVKTSTEGESGIGKNMQPYTVLLCIVKL